MLEILNWFSESWWRVLFAIFIIIMIDNTLSNLINAIRDIILFRKNTK